MLLIKCLVVILVQIGLIFCEEVKLDILMPNVSPKTKDIYLCHKFKLDEDRPVYINQFEANSTKEIAHHILLFTCNDPVEEDTWNCGEMNHSSEDEEYKPGPVCQSRQTIVFAWALDAPKLILPKDVAFKLGGEPNSYLVMQVHYANVDNFLKGDTDNSGLILKGQSEPLPNRAGVYLFSTGGIIKPHSEDYFEGACEMNDEVVMHPFAYRTHTHKLGVVNSGYLVHTDLKTGEQEWTEIGRRSPQLPQMFFPATNNVEIRKGDVIAARCTMNNFQDRSVSIGPTGNDEMCNFYIMYYVEGEKLLDDNGCFSMGPPFSYFKDFRGRSGQKLDLSKIPADASTVPEVQQEELANMKKSGHMGHGMHHGGQEESKENSMHQQHQMVDSGEETNGEKNNKNLIEQLVKEYENEVKNDNFGVDDKSDEYEEYLGELEKAYLLKKLLRKLDLNRR